VLSFHSAELGRADFKTATASSRSCVGFTWYNVLHLTLVIKRHGERFQSCR